MVVVLAVVGFVPCADKHRVKEALWQRCLEYDPRVRRLFRAFSPAEKMQKKTSATSVAERHGFRPLAALHQVPAGDRRMNKSAPLDQVRSFAAKGAPSVQIRLAR